MIKLSIITIYYNCENYILQAINSVNQQIYDYNNIHVEYILVNDSSTDNSKKYVQSYIKNIKSNIDYKLYDTNQNLGCGKARQFAIEKTTGDYIMFLDADDYWTHNNFIQKAITKIIQEDADIVEYGLIYNDKNGEKLKYHVHQELIIEDNKELSLILLFKESVIKFNLWTKIYKSSLFQKVKFSESKTYEDVEIIPLLVYYANKIILEPSCEINYRLRKNSITNKDPYMTKLGTISSIAKHFERFKDNYNILLAMYSRAMMDFKDILDNKTSEDPLFDKISYFNTYMLSYIYPNTYNNFTYNLESQTN